MPVELRRRDCAVAGATPRVITLAAVRRALRDHRPRSDSRKPPGCRRARPPGRSAGSRDHPHQRASAATTPCRVKSRFRAPLRRRRLGPRGNGGSETREETGVDLSTRSGWGAGRSPPARRSAARGGAALRFVLTDAPPSSRATSYSALLAAAGADSRAGRAPRVTLTLRRRRAHPPGVLVDDE